MAEAAPFVPRGGRALRHPARDVFFIDSHLDPTAAAGDLLVLAALAWEAPRVLIGLPRPDGTWAVLGGGESGHPVPDDGLLDLVAAGMEPVEVADLLAELPGSPYVLFPHSMRWAYGLALRDERGATPAVVVVMDRGLRSVTPRDQAVMQMVARQLRRLLTSGLTAWPGSGVAVGAGPAVGAGSGDPAASEPGPGRRGRAILDPPAPRPRSEMHPRLLRCGEVATLFDVTERTVVNWAAKGRIPSIRTVGGHLRFRWDDIVGVISERSAGLD